jgi:hypothetical protein
VLTPVHDLQDLSYLRAAPFLEDNNPGPQELGKEGLENGVGKMRGFGA